MKIAMYPGSFNPWHGGHEDVLSAALEVFDKVVIIRAFNSDKEPSVDMEFPDHLKGRDDIEIVYHKGLLVNLLDIEKYSAVIKGLRNTLDFEYEKTQQYWNEDLGLHIPTFFVLARRGLTHYSSSAIRAVRKAKEGTHETI